MRTSRSTGIDSEASADVGFLLRMSSPSLIKHAETTRDPLVPSVWGTVRPSEDPFATPKGAGSEGGCCASHPLPVVDGRPADPLQPPFFRRLHRLSHSPHALPSHASLNIRCLPFPSLRGPAAYILSPLDAGREPRATRPTLRLARALRLLLALSFDLVPLPSCLDPSPLLSLFLFQSRLLEVSLHALDLSGRLFAGREVPVYRLQPRLKPTLERRVELPPSRPGASCPLYAGTPCGLELEAERPPCLFLFSAPPSMDPYRAMVRPPLPRQRWLGAQSRRAPLLDLERLAWARLTGMLTSCSDHHSQPSPTTSRFPAGARGGNFLPPVSGPPTPNRMQMRRPSQTVSPSARDALASSSHVPSHSPSVTSARSPGPSFVDQQSNLALGSPPVWRRESEQGPDRTRVVQLSLNGPPGTPARKGSVGMDYGSVERSPGYGLGISSPSSAAGPSQLSAGPGGSPQPPPRMSRIPSRERMQASLSPRVPYSQPSPRPSSVASPTSSPYQQHHAKSPSVPLLHFPPDPARRPQDRQTSNPNLRAHENAARRGMSVGDDRTCSSGSPSGSRVAAGGERKISVSLERDGSDPAISIPLSQYPSAVNGKPASTPPARPRHASAELVLPPQPRDGRLATPPHTTIDRARDSRLISGGSPAKQLGAARVSVDENAGYRAQLSAERRSGSGDVGKPRLPQAETPPKNVTPRKSSGVLRSLFGKKKESPAPSPPVVKSSPGSSLAGGPLTPSRNSMQRDFEPRSRPSPVQPSTTPPNGRMMRPRIGSSPTVPTAAAAVGPPPRRPSAGLDYQLSAPPPPQIPLPSLLSTDSTGLLSSSDSIQSLQQREGAGNKKAVALLRRLSDQSSHSASSLSYLTSSEPPTAPANLPHFKSSGSLRLLALPDFGGSLDLGEDVGKLADALRQPALPNGDGSFQPQLDGEDSWSSLLAAMSSGSPEMISAAFEGARQSIAIQNNSELEKALADLQLEVNKQVSNLPASRSLDLLDSVVSKPPAPPVEAVPSAPPPPPSPPAPKASEPVNFPVSFPPTFPPTLAPPLLRFDLPFGPPSAPVKNPNLTIKVVKSPPSSFKSIAQTSIAPLKVAKRTLSAPSVSPDQPTSLYSPPTTNESLASPAAGADGIDQSGVMTSASLPSLRTKRVLRPASSSGRVLTIAAARRQRRRQLLNYRVMAEKMGDCLSACVPACDPLSPLGPLLIA